jgi:integrase
MSKRKRQQGTGCLYQQPGAATWYIQFYSNGVRKRESTGFTSRQAAQDLLNQRLAAVSKGEPVQTTKVRISALYDHLLTWNKAHNQNTETARWRLHLQEAFGKLVANRLSSSQVLQYRTDRAAAGAAIATINRELAMLRRMYRLGHQASPPLVTVLPHIPLASERGNERKGFVEATDYLKLRQAAEFTGELWLQVFLALGYSYGWRRGELLALQCRQCQLETRTIHLEGNQSKNREGREVVMTSQVAELLKLACKGKKPAERVLTRNDGSAVKDLRCAWRNLCASVGLGRWFCRTKGCGLEQAQQGRCPTCKARRWEYRGLLVHDLRRSAARAMRQAGLPETVAMSVTGHRTSSMFRRYAIVDHADQLKAATAIERAIQAAVDRAAAPKPPDHKVAITRPAASSKVQ